MSASLLNLATPPGAAGASQGVAAQAAQSAQAKGPMAGFEALLAAFFGDQGVGEATAGGPLAVNTAGITGPATGKPAGKGGDAAKSADAAKGDSKTTTADGAQLTAVDPSLALVAASLPNPLVDAAGQAGSAPQGETQDKAAGASTDAGLAGGKATTLAQLDDAKSAKAPNLVAPNLVAEDTSSPAQTAPSAAQTGKPELAATPQAPNLSAQTQAAGAAALPAPAPVAAAGQPKPADALAAAGKDKAQTPKVGRVEGARTETAPVSVSAAKAGDAIANAAETAGKNANSDEHDPHAAPAAAEAKSASSETSQGANSFNPATSATANGAILAHAAAVLVRGSPQTVANLAAQIAKKLDGRSSRFDVQLDPAGLGKVDVRIEIDAAGKMSAAMNFDNQQAASELKSRAGELQRALEQAGFDLSGGLSFDVAGQGGQNSSQGHDADAQPVFRGRAFQAVLDGGADATAAPSTFRQASRAGVDIRI